MVATVLLENSWLFQGLPPESFRPIADCAKERRFPAESMIFKEGDPASDLWVLAEGELELVYVIHARSPFPMKIAHIMPGDPFGWSAMARNEKYIGNARPMVDSAVWQIPAARLFEIMDRDPVAGYRIMSRLTQLISRRLHDVRTEVRWFLSSL